MENKQSDKEVLDTHIQKIEAYMQKHGMSLEQVESMFTSALVRLERKADKQPHNLITQVNLMQVQNHLYAINHLKIHKTHA